jgi:dTDP-4-amino-4,6-dideoxygalactose transaminase
MDPIMALAEKHGLKVIEDCAQAHGARYKGRSVGSIGHIGAWSFCQDKIMTTGGEGGMVTTDDEALWRSMWAYKDHGKSYAAMFERYDNSVFRWVHESFGTNWRMLEMQAVIGRIQLRRMEEWTRQRSTNAAALASALAPFAGANGPLRLPQFGCAAACRARGAGGQQCVHSCRHAQYKFYAYVRPENLAQGWTRDRIVQAFVDAGIPCYQGSCSEVYLEKAFEGTGWRPSERLPIARQLGETSLMWLVHPTLRAEDIRRTQQVMTEVLGSATGR